MFDFIKKILPSFSTNKTDDASVSGINIKLLEISNGLGKYANLETLNEESIKKGFEMLSILKDIEEKVININNSEIFYNLAIGYKNYSKWYKRGLEQKDYLDKSINYLNKAIQINSDNSKAKAELGKILIDEKNVRNLDKGKSLLDAKSSNKTVEKIEVV